ncbi:hypothetical protein [Bhargavaea beijingensis]|uniref:Uncharacterized protein n=1 Tax=Bhargavaea beijingensis TaxID=426756 RepID=A0A1G7BTF7_9BACL|nr:hypothetical protein [Bhargavaea beijingensis]MCW1926697.1 hypothetical protein [Bhargavaea beijingensis]RSK37049.1 hypothetical protein EJA12_01590 [Bhargavaea beijingensis]SDE30283.1 hypothetical protein SAMN04488126_106114 [Bhargavaea beijingensis]
MQVTEAITLFKLSVPSSQLSALVALIAAYILIRVRFGSRLGGLYGDAAFYFVLIWKGSYVLTDFGNFLKAPLSLLYYNGGLTGALAGLLAALFFIWRKGAAGTPAVLMAAIAVQSVYQIMMALMNRNGPIAETVTIALFGALLILTVFRAASSILWQRQLAALFVAVHFMVAAVQPEGFGGLPFVSTVIFGLSHLIFLSAGRRLNDQ